MDLSDEPILSIYWHSYTVQTPIVSFSVKIATNLLKFALNHGLAA